MRCGSAWAREYPIMIPAENQCGLRFACFVRRRLHFTYLLLHFCLKTPNLRLTYVLVFHRTKGCNLSFAVLLWSREYKKSNCSMFLRPVGHLELWNKQAKKFFSIFKRFFKLIHRFRGSLNAFCSLNWLAVNLLTICCFANFDFFRLDIGLAVRVLCCCNSSFLVMIRFCFIEWNKGF